MEFSCRNHGICLLRWGLTAHAALAAAPYYPGTPIATSEALDRFLNLKELLPGDEGGEELHALEHAAASTSDQRDLEMISIR